MILVAGGTGTLGSRLVSLLAERGEQVRVLTRDPARAAGLDTRTEVAVGDTGDPGALQRAVAGAQPSSRRSTVSPERPAPPRTASTGTVTATSSAPRSPPEPCT
jgi:uncharacterized protein YbjT (DUF2867 family)